MIYPQEEGAYRTAFSQSRQKLQVLDPYDIQANSDCIYDESMNCFIIYSFGRKIKITYPEGIVTFWETNTLLPLDWALIILNYLSAAKPMSLSDELVSYRELPLGDVFFQNIKTYVLTTMADYYEKCQRNNFLNGLDKSGFATIQAKADLAVRGSFAPRVPITILFWEGEEAIPSSCQLLFDKTVSQQMHIEDIAALCNVVKYLVTSG